jgi:hypothetical protein
MCPICIATAAWLSAGAGSTGGLTALLVSKRRSKLHSQLDTHRRDHEDRGDPLGTLIATVARGVTVRIRKSAT